MHYAWGFAYRRPIGDWRVRLREYLIVLVLEGWLYPGTEDQGSGAVSKGVLRAENYVVGLALLHYLQPEPRPFE